MNGSRVPQWLLAAVFFALVGFDAVAADLHPEDAARIIVNAEGGVVHDVVVAEAPSGRTYLLAVWAASEGHMPAVVVYRSFAGGFVRLVEEETLFAPIEALEFVDLDGDGTPEAYWQINSLGNARGGVFYTVYDAERTSTCSAILDYAHGVPSNDVRWDCEATPATVAARAFIEARIEADPRFARADASSLEVRSPEDAVRLWRSRYLGFAEGLQDRVTLEPFELPFAAAATGVTEASFARVSHGGVELISQFKGPVFAVDHGRAVYWVVLSPPFPHDWVRDIRVVGECFVLDDESYLAGPAITYHHVRHELAREVAGESCGVTASAPAPDATTALLRAIQNTNGPAFEAALAAGADANGADEYGQTPLMYAVARGQLGMTRRLLDLGADVGARSLAGWSPLHYAARDGDGRLVTALLEAGADLQAVNQEGATAYDLARTSGNASSLEALEQATAVADRERARVAASRGVEDGVWVAFQEAVRSTSLDELECPADWSRRYRYTMCARWLISFDEFAVVWSISASRFPFRFEPVAEWRQVGQTIQARYDLEGAPLQMQLGGYLTVGMPVVFGWDGYGR